MSRPIISGKAPKLRFQPGNFVKVQGQLYEVLYCYRLRDNPTEWMYCCEERKILSSQPQDPIGKYLQAMGRGKNTPRIVYQPFRDWSDASNYFKDIPANGNSSTFSNKKMVQQAELISSGEVITND